MDIPSPTHDVDADKIVLLTAVNVLGILRVTLLEPDYH
jgi:hypothetical protein